MLPCPTSKQKMWLSQLLSFLGYAMTKRKNRVKMGPAEWAIDTDIQNL